MVVRSSLASGKLCLWLNRAGPCLFGALNCFLWGERRGTYQHVYVCNTPTIISIICN